MEKQQIINWCSRHDKEYASGIQKERKIGDRLRKTRELTKVDLVEIIEWKFEGLEGRKKRELNLIANVDEDVLKRVSNIVFSLDTSQDNYRIKLLCVFHGIRGAVASTILTFFDPENYGVFDIHVWREIFGNKTKSLDYSPRNYVKLLSKLREIADRNGLEVRTVEKAFFKKNYDESK